jgi:hypothetical protein
MHASEQPGRTTGQSIPCEVRLPESGLIATVLFECKSSEEERVGVQKTELNGDVDSENNRGGSSTDIYYIGLDVHKKTISYCIKDVSGQIQRQGTIPATRTDLDGWVKTLPQPWTVAMEATIFTGWIYDHLLPHAAQVKVAHPVMLRAIAAAKKKNDRIDAGKIADCLRCDFLPECHMVSSEIRDRRRTLRYRHLVVRQMVQMKNRVSGLLLETGVSHNKQRLHKVKYFRELLATNKEVEESIRPLLKLSRETIVRLQKRTMLWSVLYKETRFWLKGSRTHCGGSKNGDVSVGCRSRTAAICTGRKLQHRCGLNRAC